VVRSRRLVILAGAAAAAAAVIRHGRRGARGHQAPGGILIGDAAVYDAISRLLGPFYRGIAADAAVAVPHGARVLEVGCGPGHLSHRLAGHGLEVTGVDLDPAMVERARAGIGRRRDDGRPRPTFLVGDAAALAFPDNSFDLVVSTLSLHHWAEPAAGLAEIGRVLRPGGRALIWDLRPGGRLHPFGPAHSHLPDPVEHLGSAPLRVVSARPWRWPWRLTLTQRVELVRDGGSPAPPEPSRT
jgi:SAM-dependent methyltransferase